MTFGLVCFIGLKYGSTDSFWGILSGTRRSSPVGNRPTFRIHNLINYDTVLTTRATRGLSNTKKNQKKGHEVFISI